MKFFFSLALAALCAPAVLAQNIKSAAPDQVAEKIRQLGYQAKLSKDSSGDPMIQSSANGDTFLLLFDGCTGGKDCEWIFFYSPYSYQAKDYAKIRQVVDNWNNGGDFSKASLTEDRVSLKFYLPMSQEGLPPRLFEYNFNTWVEEASRFDRKLDEAVK